MEGEPEVNEQIDAWEFKDFLNRLGYDHSRVQVRKLEHNETETSEEKYSFTIDSGDGNTTTQIMDSGIINDFMNGDLEVLIVEDIIVERKNYPDKKFSYREIMPEDSLIIYDKSVNGAAKTYRFGQKAIIIPPVNSQRSIEGSGAMHKLLRKLGRPVEHIFALHEIGHLYQNKDMPKVERERNATAFALKIYNDTRNSGIDLAIGLEPSEVRDFMNVALLSYEFRSEQNVSQAGFSRRAGRLDPKANKLDFWSRKGKAFWQVGKITAQLSSNEKVVKKSKDGGF